MRIGILATVLMASGLALSLGCGGKKAKTPEEALSNLQAALGQDNASAFVACFVESKDYEAALKELHASVRNSAAMEKTLGKEAVTAAAGKGIAAKVSDWLSGATSATRDQDATISLEGGKTSLSARKIDGAWKLEPKDVLEALIRQVVAPHVAALASAKAK